MTRLAALALVVLALSGCSVGAIIDTIFGPAGGGSPALARQARRVAECESGMNPTAVSPGGGNHGVMQINVVHRQAFERALRRPWSDVYDPIANIAYAKHLYDRQGWRPWACRP